MNNFDKILEIGAETSSLNENQLAMFIEERDENNIRKLFAAANEIKLENIGNKVKGQEEAGQSGLAQGVLAHDYPEKAQKPAEKHAQHEGLHKAYHRATYLIKIFHVGQPH